ncbi:uncharacterized protein LOC125075019 isoform X2 [Vanessa atalanta]|uniref:uncharacterized protein LOC125075019 isoform X2 n=1 Tax=Vanessa atalanta TaxID=42275 RepID=UPI001FCDDBED|nr:uncharacterized protein LOC125075019 isoform X2 [Vanessa atalanta]
MQFIGDFWIICLVYSVILFYNGRVRSNYHKVFGNQIIEYNESDTMTVLITLRNTTSYKNATLFYSNENFLTNFHLTLNLLAEYDGVVLYVIIFFEDNRNVTKPVFGLKLARGPNNTRHVCLSSCEIIIEVHSIQDDEDGDERKTNMKKPCINSSCGPNAECKNIGSDVSCFCHSNFTGKPPNCYQLSDQSECSSNKTCASDRCISNKCQDPDNTGLIAIIVCGFLMHLGIKRWKSSRNISKEEYVYTYVHPVQNQMLYADLDVGTSISNELPTLNQTVYTRIIGVLKQK